MMFAVLFAMLAAASAETQPACNVDSPIVVENARPGSPSTEWDVNGAGSPEVQGFATRASLLPGATVRFKIKTQYAEPLRVDIYRLGYYNGDGARKVGQATIVNAQAAARQPACVSTEPKAELVDCGNWAVVALYALPADAVTGLYFARAVLPSADPDKKAWRADASRIKTDRLHAVEGADPRAAPAAGPHKYGAAGRNRLRNALREPRASHIWFTVRASGDGPRGLLFQSSDQTWHAYNGWGGYTTYGTFEYPYEHAPGRAPLNLSDPDHALRRAYKRSYNTPLVTRDYRAVNAPLTCEYPAIRFLEKAGYDLHYAAAADLSSPARARRLLRRSTAYLSVGHDEYWSYEQRAAVEEARDKHGVHLNFWSANEAYWAVRWEGSRHAPETIDLAGDGAAGDDSKEDAGRTIVCYKETQSLSKLDPLNGSWTGTFRDSAPHNPKGAMPENALTGTIFVANAQRVDAMAVDGARYGAHRAWWGTNVARMAGLPLGVEPMVLYPGLLGHEWDEDVDNGWRPAALQTLATTTIDNVQVIQDAGAVFDSGTATHSLVLHRRPDRGAWTFGAGTVQWSWGLDPEHDPNDPQRANKYTLRVGTDQRGACPEVQQLTVNVLAMMGLVPGSLPPNLRQPDRSTDEEPPSAGVDFAEYRPGTVPTPARLVDVRGWAADDGGVVASVEVSWQGGEPSSRWHPAEIEQLGARVHWSLGWGTQRWELLHGEPPGWRGEGARRPLWLRVADDSGNQAVFRVDDVMKAASDAREYLPEQKPASAAAARQASKQSKQQQSKQPKPHIPEAVQASAQAANKDPRNNPRTQA